MRARIEISLNVMGVIQKSVPKRKPVVVFPKGEFKQCGYRLVTGSVGGVWCDQPTAFVLLARTEIISCQKFTILKCKVNNLFP
jgi:hypothetical protein